MRSLKELKEAIQNNTPLFWDDPDPIRGCDYTITYIENINEEDFDEPLSPILIQYNGGMSEAEVYLHEILYKK